MKYLISIVLTIALLGGISTGASAATPISVTVDGELQRYAQSPLIVEGRTVVPMRPIFEKLGATIGWNQEKQSIMINKGDTQVELKIGSRIAKVNGADVQLDIEPLLINEHTMVPVRFVCDVTDAQIDWIEEEQSIAIKTAADQETDDKVSEEQTDIQIGQKIVSIEITKADGNLITGSATALQDGLFITTAELLAGATSADLITAEGERYSVQGVVVTDQTHDLAVIKTNKKIDIKPLQTESVQFTEADESVSVLVAGKEQHEIVEGAILEIDHQNGTDSIQINAELPEQSAGAPVLNEQGKVIGILTGEQTTGGHVAVSLDVIEPWLTNELSQDFDELAASFPAAGLQAADTQALDQLKEQLNAQHRVLKLPTGSMKLGEWNVQTDGDKTLITSEIDPSQYLDYVKHYGKTKPLLEQQAAILTDLLTTQLPNQKVSLQLLYIKDFAFKPMSFDAAELENRDGKWFVRHAILELQVAEENTTTIQP